MLDHRIAPVCALVAFLLASGCDGTAPAAGKAAGAPGAAPVPEVGVVTVETRSVTLTTELPGRTAPYRIAEVRPQVGGIIQERSFEEGAEITAGQVLYQIDPAPYEAARDSADAALARERAALERARLKADRYAKLLRSQSVSQEDYDDVQVALKEAAASVAVDEAALATARIQLAYTRVTSPIAGRIGRSALTQGALVTASQELALATVQQLDPIYVDLTQSSAQLLRLRLAVREGRLARPSGEPPRVTLTLEDGSSYEHAGRLALYEVSVAQDTGTVTLRATFPNPDHLLLPGMFVRAAVEEGVRPDAVLVPQQAVQRDRRGNPTALVLGDDGKVEERRLQTGRTIGGGWLIDAGLRPGDRLIVEGVQKVRPGEVAQGVDVSGEPAFSALAGNP